MDDISHLMVDPKAQKLYPLLAPVVKNAGFVLVRLSLCKDGDMVVVLLLAEKADGTITVGECASLSRAVARALEETDAIKEAYRLEVSSPGVERPLSQLQDFTRFAGRMARLEVVQKPVPDAVPDVVTDAVPDVVAADVQDTVSHDGRWHVSGVIEGCQKERKVVIIKEQETQTTHTVPFLDIVKARLVFLPPTTNKKTHIKKHKRQKTSRGKKA